MAGKMYDFSKFAKDSVGRSRASMIQERDSLRQDLAELKRKGFNNPRDAEENVEEIHSLEKDLRELESELAKMPRGY